MDRSHIGRTDGERILQLIAAVAQGNDVPRVVIRRVLLHMTAQGGPFAAGMVGAVRRVGHAFLIHPPPQPGAVPGRCGPSARVVQILYIHFSIPFQCFFL